MPELFAANGYVGPADLHEDLDVALSTLAEHLTIEHSSCETHTVILVSGLDADNCLDAAAVYLTNAIAQTISANLEIRRALFDEDNLNRELLVDIVAVIGDNNDDVDDDFNTNRDPWIWEGISHMLVHLSSHDPSFHPTGEILAKTSIKYDVHDHGLDLISIYSSGTLGVSAGECKAYLDNPSRGITDASNKLSEVDRNLRSLEIRATVHQLRSSLDADDDARIAGAFWEDERSYFPFVCCDAKSSAKWNRNRKSLRGLAIPVENKILFPMEFADAKNVFNKLCDRIRIYASIGA